MNKKGFTLIELLAVIMLLTIISAITVFSVGSVINNSRESISETQIKNIEEAAKSYYLKEGIENEIYGAETTKTCVNLSYLIEKGYVNDDKIISPETNEEINGSVKIVYKSKQYSYEYQETSCSDKDMGIICHGVTNDTKTTGNVPTGSYLAGDEYICEVKDGTKYHFFVLSSNNEKVSLILDRNIYYDSETNTSKLTDEDNFGTVAWQTSGINADGPVTAMDYLYNATKSWNNVLNIQMDYTDEGNTGDYGYGTIKTEDGITKITKKDGTEITVLENKEGYENLKARLPYKIEVYSFNGTNLWMHNYLLNYETKTGEGLKNIYGIYGYWILSSYLVDSDQANIIHYAGSFNRHSVTSAIYGVRPVIEVSKQQIK